MDTRSERVVLETARHRVTGTLHLPRDGYRSRIIDFLNSTDREFIALTDVEIVPLGGPEAPERRPFVALSRRSIVLAMETSEDL